MFSKKVKLAFSLVEISILLVIISLVIAGLVSGIRSLEYKKLNRLIVDITIYHQNIKDFYDSYNAYPGDFDNAIDIWGESEDGDNDGRIEWPTESLVSFQHLTLSGIVKEKYNGISDKVYFQKLRLHPPIECSNMGYDDMADNCAQIGNKHYPNGAGFRPRESFFIDNKIDDGLPLSGLVRFKVVKDITKKTCGDEKGYIKSSSYKGCNLLFSIDVNNEFKITEAE